MIRSVHTAFSTFVSVMDRGGVTMWPLLLLSVVSLGLVIDRTFFWARMHGRRGRDLAARLGEALRKGDRAAVLANVRGEGRRSIYGGLAASLAEDGFSEAVAIEAIEAERPAIERFMTSLSTIITAAPMLGILGTVLGIINSFELLGGQNVLTDPKEVSAGIAEALITTATGLSVALMTLFPFMAFRAQAERAFGRLEAMAAAAAQAAGKESTGPSSEPPQRVTPASG
jgi:biopolymer transport protein ExbB